MANTQLLHKNYVKKLMSKDPIVEDAFKKNIVVARFQRDADTTGLWIELERKNHTSSFLWSTPDWLHKDVKYVITGNRKKSWVFTTDILLKLSNSKKVKEVNKTSKGFHLSLDEANKYSIKRVKL